MLMQIDPIVSMEPTNLTEPKFDPKPNLHLWHSKQNLFQVRIILNDITSSYNYIFLLLFLISLNLISS